VKRVISSLREARARPAPGAARTPRNGRSAAGRVLFPLLLAACNDTTPAWELDNDRIIAVRATPPQIAAGERARLDLLVTAAEVGPTEVSPTFAAIAAEAVPPGLEGAVVSDDDGWWVVAPDDLDAAEPVPLVVAVTVDVGGDQPLAAIKTVTLGASADNPALGAVTIDGEVARDGLVVDVDAEVPLMVEAGPTDEIDWLTSLGELDDISDAAATLTPDLPGEGHLAVVVRDTEGGVTWGFWAIEAR
jgi:hypothetical protein